MNPRGRFKWSFFLVASLLLAIVSLAAAQDATPPAPKAAPVVASDSVQATGPGTPAAQYENHTQSNNQDPRHRT